MESGLGDDMTGDDFDLATAINTNANSIRNLLILIVVVALGQLVVFGSVVYGGWLVLEDQEDRAEADREILADTSVQSCENHNFTKQAVRDVINTAISDGSNGSSLTQVEGFNELPPTVQQFFENLSQSSGPSTADRLRAYRDGLIDEDCEAIAAQIDDELD